MSDSKNCDRQLWASLMILSVSVMMIATACGGTSDTTTSPPPPATTVPAAVSSTTTAADQPATTTTVAATPNFTTTVGLDYTTNHKLDVYAPVERADWPIVVVVHGLGGIRGGLAPLAEAIAAEGAVVFNISTEFSVPPIDGIQDIACAIRFARGTAREYGGDPTSITLVGYSSGAAKGSIVAMDGDAYEGDCVVSDGSALPNAFVGYEGPFDYAGHVYGVFNVPRLKEEDPVMWEAVNPYSHIGGNPDLIVRLIHGRDDDSRPYDVPLEASAEFNQALAAAGYDVEVTYLDGATHSSLRPGTEAFEVTLQRVLDTADI